MLLIKNLDKSFVWSPGVMSKKFMAGKAHSRKILTCTFRVSMEALETGLEAIAGASEKRPQTMASKLMGEKVD